MKLFADQELGVCTWTFGELPLEEIASKAAAIGLDGVELLGDLDTFQSDGRTPESINRLMADYDLKIYSLTPANVDLAHPDTAVRQHAIEYYTRLLDFAAALGNPLISCHGYVGRVAPLSSLSQELDLLTSAVQQLAERAESLGLTMVFEVLNRYESHLVNTAADAVSLVEQVDRKNLRILLDAYHMNIEELDMAGAIRLAGDRLGLYHMADSNRQAIGRGHIKFGEHLWALEDIGYKGPFIFECTAPGPNPFTPIKDEASLAWLETYLRESHSWF